MAKRCRPLLVSICATTCAAQYVVLGGNVGNAIPTNVLTNEPAWPAATAAASNATWSKGHQPARLEDWPQIGFGTDKRVLLPCWKKVVLHDHANGWPGLCKALQRAENFTTVESCRSLCWNEPRCSVWQFVNQTALGQCWVGFGTDCAYREGDLGVNGKDISVQGAERLMHGEVRVMKNLSGWKINNLYNLGMFDATSEVLSIQRCKAWCYSNIACEYWQYGPGGCWVDAPLFSTNEGNDPANVVQYPLTTNGGASQTTTEAKTMNWGEYIQHYCPPQAASPTPPPPLVIAPPPTTPAPTDAGLLSKWWMWALLGAGILGGGGAAIYFLFLKQPGDAKAARSTRGVPIKTEYSDDLMTESSEARNLVSPSPPRRNPDADYMAEPTRNAYEGDYGPPNPPARYDDRSMPDTPQDFRGGGGSASQQWVPKNLLNAAPGPLPRDTAQQGPPMQHQVTHGGGMVSSMPPPTQLQDDAVRAASVLRRPTLMQQGGMPYQQPPQQQYQPQYPQQQMYPGAPPQRLM